MSGGVDSSVAALLLKNAYFDSHGRVRIAEGLKPKARFSHAYDCTGVFMRSYNLDGCQERDARDARLVAQKIGIPFYVWNFEKEYKKKVVDYMIRGYRRGITPNPDVMCNKEIKFGLFLKKALALGADYVATGHYVRIKNYELRIKEAKTEKPLFIIRHSLFAAKDSNKDQSYFLWTLKQDQLRHCLFPIGDYLKPEVRAIARRAGLPTAEKKDSQGICFLGKVSLADFLRKRIRPKIGVVLDAQGRPLGEHDGSYFYTIGQRHGLNIANRPLRRSFSEASKSQIANSREQMANRKGQMANGGKRRNGFKPLYVAEKALLGREKGLEFLELGAFLARPRRRILP